jgi:hypothetical protein
MPGINDHKYPSPLTLMCVQCGTAARLYTQQRAAGFCCPSCGAYNEYDGKRHLRAGGKLTKSKTATFKIGTVFHIDEIEFVLINYLVKEETAYKTSWTEYTLFHPVEGCRTLSESDGHYTLLKASRFYNKSNLTREASHPEKGTFQLYSRYKYTIRHAEGEFLSDITGKELPACDDYVNPPYILSYERTAHEAWWYEGEYVNHKTLKSWLKEPVSLPQREGVAPSEPFDYNLDRSQLVKLTALFIGLLILAQLILSGFVTTAKAVSSQRYTSTDNAAEKTYISQPFEITANHCATDFDISSNIDNNWLETEFTLVNETTGDQYYFSGVVEFYSGYEDGEAWSEGSSHATLTVGNLTKGRYHYNVTTASDATKPVGNLNVTVIENVSLVLNFWLAALCLLIFPLYIYIRRKNWERRQWSNSDYSPFDTE